MFTLRPSIYINLCSLLKTKTNFFFPSPVCMFYAYSSINLETF